MRWSVLLLAGTLATRQAEAAPCEGPPSLSSVAALGDADAQAALGYWFAEERQTECAIVAFKRSLRLNPSSFDARYNLGVALVDSGDYEGAAEELRAASRLEPGNAQVWLVLGSVLLESGQPAEAEAALQTAFHRGASAASTLAELAEAQNQLGKRGAAIATLERLLRLEPESAIGKTMLESLRRPSVSPASSAARAFQSGDFATAESAFREALKASPANALVHFNLGLTLLSLDRPVDAVEHLRRAVEIQSDLAHAWLALGTAHHRLGRLDASERAFRKAASWDPQQVEARHNLGIVLASQSRHSEAESALREAAALRPGDATILTALGMTLARQQRLEDAIETLGQVIRLSPRSAGAHINLGVVLGDNSQWDEALEEFETALDLEPESGQAQFQRGRALYEMRRYGEALEALVSARRALSEAPEILRYIGQALNRSARYEEAAAALRRAILDRPDNHASHSELGFALLQMGRPDEAVEALKRALELNPRNSVATVNLIKALYREGSEETAQYSDLLRDLKRQESAAARAKVLSNFALAAASREEWGAAVGQLREAVEVCGACPIQPTLRKNLGLVLADSGDFEGALMELRAARSLDDHPDIEYALGVVERAASSERP